MSNLSPCVCCLSDDEDSMINISTIDKITKTSYRESLLEYVRVKFVNEETFVICFECRNILRKTVSFIQMCRDNHRDLVVAGLSNLVVQNDHPVIIEETLNQSNTDVILNEIATLDNEADSEDTTISEINERLIIEDKDIATSQINTRRKSTRRKVQEEASPKSQTELVSERDTSCADHDNSTVLYDIVSEKNRTKSIKLKTEAADRKKAKAKKSFLCGDCGRTFPTAQRLNIHNLTHSGLKDFKCVEKLANGDICGKDFATEFRLKTHERTHTGQKPYKCKFPDCNARFAQGNALTNHKRIHSKEKPYKCSYCDKRFSQNTILKTHLAIHLGKNVTCTWSGCEKKFARKAFMIVHMREHTGEKPYKCTFENCTNSYMQKSHLTRHIDTHKGIKFKCDVCDKEYSKAWSLKQHKYSHDESLPYKCPQENCSVQFSRRDKLNKHIEKLHKSSRNETLNAEIVLNEQPVIVETKDIQPVDTSRIEYMSNGKQFVLYPDNNTQKIVISSGNNADSEQHIYTISEV